MIYVGIGFIYEYSETFVEKNKISIKRHHHFVFIKVLPLQIIKYAFRKCTKSVVFKGMAKTSAMYEHVSSLFFSIKECIFDFKAVTCWIKNLLSRTNK